MTQSTALPEPQSVNALDRRFQLHNENGLLFSCDSIGNLEWLGARPENQLVHKLVVARAELDVNECSQLAKFIRKYGSNYKSITLNMTDMKLDGACQLFSAIFVAPKLACIVFRGKITDGEIILNLLRTWDASTANAESGFHCHKHVHIGDYGTDDYASFPSRYAEMYYAMKKAGPRDRREVFARFNDALAKADQKAAESVQVVVPSQSETFAFVNSMPVPSGISLSDMATEMWTKPAQPAHAVVPPEEPQIEVVFRNGVRAICSTLRQVGILLTADPFVKKLRLYKIDLNMALDGGLTTTGNYLAHTIIGAYQWTEIEFVDTRMTIETAKKIFDATKRTHDGSFTTLGLYGHETDSDVLRHVFDLLCDMPHIATVNCDYEKMDADHSALLKSLLVTSERVAVYREFKEKKELKAKKEKQNSAESKQYNHAAQQELVDAYWANIKQVVELTGQSLHLHIRGNVFAFAEIDKIVLAKKAT